MSQPRHIINKQILEIHLPEEEDVNSIQADISRLYQEKLIPIINDLCDRHSSGGRHLKIEQLNIDLGTVELKEIEGVFAQKFAEAIASQKVQVVSRSEEKPVETTAEKTPLDVLSYYLMTGSLPWWAPSSSKDYLCQQLDVLIEAPSNVFKALLRQVGQKKAYLDRFMNTFSEAQVLQSLRTLTPHSLDHLPKIKQDFAEVVISKPERFATGLTAPKISKAFWSAVFSRVAIVSNQADLVGHAIHQVLRVLGADFSFVLEDIRENQPSLDLLIQMDAQSSRSVADQTAIYQLAKKIGQKHPANPLLKAFLEQLSQVLSHPLFPRIGNRRIQDLANLLKNLDVALGRAGATDAATLKVVTGTNLEPIARHLHQLEGQLKEMEPFPRSNVMEKMRSSFEDTDSIAVQNAGLVIFWPFLQRFFENLELLNGKAFNSESAKYKAAAVLQYIASAAEEETFEGQLTLNKVLCGINLADPIALEPLTSEEIEIAEGLMKSVISRGPHWKNLSLAGFRSSYLQREGLLRSRDGHWLLQVKKETYDITLERLPWGFSTVKLPWMNEILIVEWI